MNNSGLILAAKIAAIILFGVLVYSYFYLTMPIYSFSWTSGFESLALVTIAIGAGVNLFTLKRAIGFYVTGLLILLIGFISYACSGIAVFGSVTKYRNVIGEKIAKAETQHISADLSPIDPQNVRVNDAEMANKLTQQKLNKTGDNLGSSSSIGDGSLQNVGNKMVWLLPLLHRDNFWTIWDNNDKGTIGFSKVSASNPDDVELVTSIKGKPVRIVYQPNAYFGKDLMRHIRSKGFKSVGLTDISFEQDDNENVWWVVTTYENKIGVSGIDDATGAVIVNPETGDLKWYSIAEMPEWVDCIQPWKFVKEQVDYYGEYFNNSYWGQDKSGTFHSAEPGELGKVYGKDGKCYYYVGLTSTNPDDEATLGFYLVDTRTKAVKHYIMGGKNEIPCLNSLEGAEGVKASGYKATYPANLENVAGSVAYFTTLKDESGQIKKYGFVNIETPRIYGVGDDVQQAMLDYTSRMGSTANNSLVPDENTGVYQVEGVVTRYAQTVSNNNSNYIFRIDALPNSSLQMRQDMQLEIPLTKVGDKVHIVYRKPVFDSSSVYQVIKFDNLNLTTSHSKSTQQMHTKFEKVSTQNLKNTEDKNAEAYFESLTKEQKAEIYKAIKK